jgi:hypothetical protein
MEKYVTKSARNLAQYDIMQYIHDTGGELNINYVFNKESSKLNRELGIHKINKQNGKKESIKGRTS